MSEIIVKQLNNNTEVEPKYQFYKVMTTKDAVTGETINYNVIDGTPITLSQLQKQLETLTAPIQAKIDKINSLNTPA